MKFVTILIVSLALCCLSMKSDVVTDSADYEVFLSKTTTEKKEITEDNYDFWNNKFMAAPNQYPYLVKMAAAKNKLFKSDGNILHLTEATALLEKASSMVNDSNAGILRSLARNYISEHRFTESKAALVKAEQIGQGLNDTKKMLFDINMELGDYESAEKYLNDLDGGLSDFDYLIRLSKWADHKGDLGEAIFQMNMALEGAKASNNKALIQWTTTNLADYYGHDGKIEKSYDYYLKALEMDPSDAYAKKGIAWILYSYEKNTKEAYRILESIESYYNSPDHLLLKAELAEYDQEASKAESYIATYLDKVENEPAYGKMYNKYNVMIYCESGEKLDLAKTIAQEEVDMRPTAQSYSLLALAHYKNGNQDIAGKLLEEHVLDKTYEPEPLMIMAEIFSDINPKKDISAVKADLLGSGFELGPIAQRKIQAF